MNIYLHVEVAVRELDSKLLLAILAAANGHEIVISSMGEIIKGLKKGILTPGIFHTKSLTPSKSKIDRHQEIINNKSIITCIDEEHGLFIEGYDQFAIDRYSNKSIGQTSAVFGWGSEDTETLKNFYPENSQKIYKTGSPRADLWKSMFNDYWINPKGMPERPFLLVSSNMICTEFLPFHQNIKLLRELGAFNRDPELFKKRFYAVSEDFKKLHEFIEAIIFLAANNNGYDIVVRPHPQEDINTWRVFLEKIPNVHIVRQDSITAWVKNAFAVMHNGCTTALEATTSGKTVLTFNPFDMQYDNKLFNTLGHILKTKEELLEKANYIFEKEKISNTKKEKVNLPNLISKKIYLDDNELAAQKIIKIWEGLTNEKLSKNNNWIKYNWYLKIINVKKFILIIASKLFPNIIKPIKENHKFPAFDPKDIYERVNRLKQILSINKKIECKVVSKRTILIKSS